MHNDIDTLGVVEFEGQSAQLYRANTRARIGEPHTVELEIDVAGTRLILYGYFDGDEFMELERGRVG